MLGPEDGSRCEVIPRTTWAWCSGMPECSHLLAACGNPQDKPEDPPEGEGEGNESIHHCCWAQDTRPVCASRPMCLYHHHCRA